MEWIHRDGMKILSRNLLAIGNYDGAPRLGFLMNSVLAMPGFDPVRGIGNQCIMQGIELGYFKPSVRVYAVERQPLLVPHIIKHAEDNNIWMKMFAGDLRDYIPTAQLDVAMLDMMGAGHHWIGKKIVEDIVPRMKKRSGIGINLNVQHAKGQTDYDEFIKEIRADADFWRAEWNRSFQIGGNNPELYRGVIEPFSGVACFELCLPTFVSIHMYMKDTDFKYRGCLKYYANAKKGVQNMLSLRYER